MQRLIFYTTSGCHLCEVAEQLICQTLDFEQFEVEVIDIAASDGLIERYGVRIPVLAFADGGDELCWPFDQLQLSAFARQG